MLEEKFDEGRWTLGINPEFEGLVMPRWRGETGDRIRDAVLFDTAEGAFAYFNLLSLEQKQKLLFEAFRYARNGKGDRPISLPILEGWNSFFSMISLEESVERVWQMLEKGVRQRHEGQDNFITKNAMTDSNYVPHLTRGGIWHAKPVRRGDENKQPAGDLTITNAEIKNGRFNIAGFDFSDPTTLSRLSSGRERRHGLNEEILRVAGYPVQALLLYLSRIDSAKKADMGLAPDYQVVTPFNFDKHEYLVVEAVLRRYMPIGNKLNKERNIFVVSNFLNDHPEIYSSLMADLIKKGKVSVGVGKLWFADSPHRKVLESIDSFLREEQGYEYDGFAVDFRSFGQNFQTVSIVYMKPDRTRMVHVIYDEQFKVPPLFLFKIRQGEWSREQIERSRTWNLEERPTANPFSNYGRWYPDFDRHSQQYLVTRITRPDQFIVEQFPYLKPEYLAFEGRGRLALAR